MTGGWNPESWDSEKWADDTSPVRDSWADAYRPTEARYDRRGPVVVLAAGGGAVAATALGLLVLLLGGVVVAVAAGVLVLLGACALGSAYLRGAR